MEAVGQAAKWLKTESTFIEEKPVAWVVLSGAISCDTLCHGLYGVGGRIFMRRRRR